MSTVAGEGAGTITSGQRLTSAIGTNRKIPNWDGNLINISANLIPLFKLTDAMKKNQEVHNVAYFHLETDILPTVIQIDATGYNSSATTIGVAAGHSARLQVGTTLKNLRTGEMLWVSSVVNDSTVGVTRQYCSTASGTLAANEEIAIISFADTEGNTSPSGESSEPTQKLNYVQTVRQAWEASRRDANIALYGGDELPRLQKDAYQKVLMNIERQMLFNNGLSANNPTQTGGAEYWIATNVVSVGGLLTEQYMIDNIIRPWFRVNNGMDSTMYGFCGENFIRALNSMGRDAIRYRPDDYGIGISIGEYETDWGTFKIVKHGLLTPKGSSVSAANNGWQGYFFGLQMDNIGRRTFKNSNLKIRKNIQQPDKDGVKHEYLADVGFAMYNEQSHLVAKGITG